MTYVLLDCILSNFPLEGQRWPRPLRAQAGNSPENLGLTSNNHAAESIEYFQLQAIAKSQISDNVVNISGLLSLLFCIFYNITTSENLLLQAAVQLKIGDLRRNPYGREVIMMDLEPSAWY